MKTTTTTTTTTPLTEANRNAVVQEEHIIDHCLVCYSSLVDYHVVTPCGHSDICGVCHLRLRYLHADRKCPICKSESEQVIVDLTTAEKTEFNDYNIWGNDLGVDFIYNEESQMFVRAEYYERELKPLFGYRCNHQACLFDASQVSNSKDENNNNKNKKPIRVLQDHLRNQHKLALCQLCVDHQRDFVSQLPRFTPSQLYKHLSQGEPASGFHGHPLCEFCRPKRFYDITALHQHLALEHFKCHVCDRQGVSDQYFKNYAQLEKHFDRQHFLCRDVQCMMARFVVFGNELDLKHHQRTVHGATLGDTKIQLEFRVARSSANTEHQSLPNEAEFNYGVDGQAFVPAALPGNNDGESNTVTLHPLHVQRTAQLREQAASLRTSHNQTTRAEEFPTLQPNTAAATAALRTGWTSTAQRTRARGPAGAVTPEDFPSLPVAAPAPRHKVNNLQALRPQARPASTATASWGVAARPAPPSSNGNHFPSLSAASAPSVPVRKKPPPMSSLSDFPAPPTSFSPYIGVSTTSVAASNVTIDDMKATMGSFGYKQLKQLTQNLVVHETVNPVDYVQLTAALFDDTNTHQKFVRALLQSCPPHEAAQEALQRLQQLQPRGLAVSTRASSNSQNSSNNTNNNAWTKKSKENKELRQLAFGRGGS